MRIQKMCTFFSENVFVYESSPTKRISGQVINGVHSFSTTCQNQTFHVPPLCSGDSSSIMCNSSCCSLIRGKKKKESFDSLLLMSSLFYAIMNKANFGRGVTCEGLQSPRVITANAKFLDAPELVKITQVSCGEYHTDIGEVYTWGLGNMGQLGHVYLQSNDKELIPRRVASRVTVKEVACGGVHTSGLTVEGALYAWGGGQLTRQGVSF